MHVRQVHSCCASGAWMCAYGRLWMLSCVCRPASLSRACVAAAMSRSRRGGGKHCARSPYRRAITARPSTCECAATSAWKRRHARLKWNTSRAPA